MPARRRRALTRIVSVLVRRRLIQRSLAFARLVVMRKVFLANMQDAGGGTRVHAFVKAVGPFCRMAELLQRLEQSPDACGRLTVDGFEQIVQLREQNVPVIVACPHLALSGNVIAQVLHERGVPVLQATVRQDLLPDGLREWKGGERFNPENPLVGLLRLRRGWVLSYGADVPGPGIPVPFLGGYASFPTLLGRLATGTGAALIPTYVHEEQAGHWRLVFEAPIRPDGQSPEAITRELIGRIEAIIRRYPYQWSSRLRPFLSRVSFRQTGRLPVLLAVAGPDTAGLAPAYERALNGREAMDVVVADVTGQDLPALVERARSANCEVVLLVQPSIGDELGEMRGLISMFFHNDIDLAAYDPPPGLVAPAGSLSAFSLCLIKTAVLERLVRHGVQHLDGAVVRRLRRRRLHSYRVPSQATIAAQLREWEALGGDLQRLMA